LLLRLTIKRSKLSVRTPLTLELFLKWKADKRKQQTEADKVAKEKRDSDIKAGKAMRSGREIFEFNPDLFKDEDDVLDTEELEPEQEEVSTLLSYCSHSPRTRVLLFISM